MDKVKSIYEITSSIHIIKVKSSILCSITNELMNEGDIGFAFIYHNNFKVINYDSRSMLIDSLQRPSDADYIQEITFNDSIIYETECSICSSTAENGDRIYTFTEFPNHLKAWVHEKCKQDLIEILEKELVDYSSEIVTGHL